MLPDKPIPINSAYALLNLVSGTNPFTTIISRYKYIAIEYSSDSNIINLVFSDVPKTDSSFTYVTTTGQLASLLNSYNVCKLVPNLQVCFFGDNIEIDLNLYYAGYYKTSNPTAYLLTLVTSRELLEDNDFVDSMLSNR